MSKTEFESQLNVTNNFGGTFPRLKIEQQTLAETFRRRSVPESRAYIERFFGDLSKSLISSMGEPK